MLNSHLFLLINYIDTLPKDLIEEYVDYLSKILNEFEYTVEYDDNFLNSLWDKVYSFYLEKIDLVNFDWADIEYLEADIKNEIILMEYCDISSLLCEPYSMHRLVDSLCSSDDEKQHMKYKNFMKNLKEISKRLYDTTRDDSGLIISGMKETELRLFLTNNIMKSEGIFYVKRIEKALYYNLINRYLHIPELNDSFKIGRLTKLKNLFLECTSESEKKYLEIEAKINSENLENTKRIGKEEEEKNEKKIKINLDKINIDTDKIELGIEDIVNNYRLERLLNVSTFCHLIQELDHLRFTGKKNILSQRKFHLLKSKVEKMGHIPEEIINEFAPNLIKA